MKIVIIGAGAVGFDLAHRISQREHDVIVVESRPEVLQQVQEHLDCRLVAGHGAHPACLEEIGMRDCHLFAAVTDRDEVNIVACLTAHRLGARVKVARVRQDEYYRGGRLLLEGIDLAINPDQETVNSIRELLFQTAASEIYEFADGRVRVVGARVDRDSPIAGKTLEDIVKLFRGRPALVTSIVRAEETLIPRGETVILPDDLVYLTGERVTVDRALYHVHAKTHLLEKVMIVGVNSIGLELARDLLEAGIRVKIIDRNEDKCQLAAAQLHRALVLHGDGSDTDLLQSEGVNDMDGFVALSGDEETNIMACLLARHHGARKTVCLVNRNDYVPLLPLLGVDAAISPRLSTSARIARFVKRGALVSAESLGFSGAEILQFDLGQNLRCLGKPLSKLNFPREAVMAAVIQGHRIVTPRGNTVLQAGNQVIVFALPSVVAEVEAFFAAE